MSTMTTARSTQRPVKRSLGVVGAALATVSLGIGTAAISTPAAHATGPAVTSAVNKTVVARLGSKGVTVRTLQQNLTYLGYYHSTVDASFGKVTLAAVKSYQSKHGWYASGIVNRALFDYISKDVAATKARAAKAPRGIDKRCLVGARVICASKSAQKVYYFNNGKLVLSADARFGRPALPTREGTFHVYKMGRMWFSSLYHVYMPYSMFFSGGEAVHYSADFAANGYGLGSHGCINIRDKAKVAYIYNHTKIGDKVVVYR